MTARLHSLRHQDKKTSVSGQRQSNQQQQSQQATSQGPSPAPSPSPSLSPSPKHSDGRRANKPLMEKRRRARINQSLAALKALILDSARLENTKHSKLEKADILELTVRHLQRQRSLTQPGLSRYKAGYQDCSREVSRYLDAPDIITGNTSPMDPAVKQRLLRHLDSCVSELDLDLGSRPDSGLGSSPGSVNDRVTGVASPSPLEHHATPTPHCSTALNPALIKSEMPEMETARPDSSTTAGDENNNSSRPNSAFSQVNPGVLDPHNTAVMSLEQASTSGQNPNMLSVVQVIPSRLPDGQVVFLLPSHYVQLAAAAAANGISIGPNPPTAIWAATNMSLLKATDKLAKRPHEADIGQDWSQDGSKPSKSPRIEQPEQPLDFTTSKKLKVTRTLANDSPNVIVTQQHVEQPQLHQIPQQQHHPHQQQQLQQQLPEHTEMSMIQEDEDDEARPSSQAGSEIVRISSPSPARQPQPVKDEEGMWRPW